MSEEIKQLFEDAVEKAETLQKAARRYEIASTTLEELKRDNIRCEISITGVDDERIYSYTPVTDEQDKKIRIFLKQCCEDTINEAKETTEEILGGTVSASIPTLPAKDCVTPQEKEPAGQRSKITNEELIKLSRQGLTQKQIADKTGIKPNTISHRFAHIKSKMGTEKKEQKPKTFTKELISDEVLEEMYFKQGLTVKQIAEKYNVNTAGLYKRTETLRDKRYQIAKECVSTQ